MRAPAAARYISGNQPPQAHPSTEDCLIEQNREANCSTPAPAIPNPGENGLGLGSGFLAITVGMRPKVVWVSGIKDQRDWDFPMQ